MGRPKRARRGRDLADRIEEGGAAVLTTIWAAGVRLGAAVLGPLCRFLATARAWFFEQRRAVQVIAVALLALGSVAAVRSLRGRLAESAPYVLDETEALARVIRSEAGTSPMVERVHVAWATRNLAAEQDKTVAEMACMPCGPQERGRPVASWQAATDADRELARHVLASPAHLDPTGGATHFVNPALQDRLAASGRPGYKGRPYKHVRRVWSESYGWEPYYRLSAELELWGTKRKR